MPEQIKQLKQISTKEENHQFTAEEEARISEYKAYDANFSDKIATLKVPYNDLSVLLKNSPELEFANKFFSDITCGDVGIERLLYEVIRI